MSLDHQISQEVCEMIENNEDIQSSINKMITSADPKNKSIVVDWDTLDAETQLGDTIIETPDSVLAYAHRGLRQYIADNYDDMGGVNDLDHRFRVIGLPDYRTRNVRDIWPDDINTLVSINCKIEKRTVVNSEIRRLAFICNSCRTTEMKSVFADSINAPNKCDSCDATGFTPDYKHEENEWVPSQLLRIKEKAANLEGTNQPESMKAKMKNDICGNVEGGDDLTITGIVRADEDGGTNQDTVTGMYLEVIGIDRDDERFDQIDVSEQDRREVRDMVENNDVSQLLRDNVAPSIYGYGQIKEAMAYSLVSGLEKNLRSGERIRGDIHTLLIGDPGVGKSQIMSYAYNVAPRAVKSSGKGSTAAGLTASAVQDDFGSGDWSLEAGALVLADGGLAVIDEFDKMKSSDRSAIHEAMEQQQISVAKAGINTTLNTRCGLVAAANPQYGRWDTHEPIVDQINLASPLISRFDLIFTIKDTTSNDDEVADHIIENHRSGVQSGDIDDMETVDNSVSPDRMRQWIKISKEIEPEITDLSKDKIKRVYTQIRENAGDDDSMPVTARKLEAFIRISEAVARLHLSETVEPEHVDIAHSVIMKTLSDVYTDADGNIDSDVVYRPDKTDQDHEKFVRQLIKNRMDAGQNGVTIDDIKSDLRQTGRDISFDVVEVVSDLEQTDQSVYDISKSNENNKYAVM